MTSVTKKNYPAYLPWLIWGLCALVFFSEYAARVAPSVMTQELQLVFRTNAVGLGILGAFFYYAYVSMQIPVGMLVDRYGAHKLLTITTVICAMGAVLFGVSHALWLACIARAMIGFGAAFAFVGTLKLASVWFPASRFGLLAGMTQAMGMFGAAAGEAPVAYAAHHVGWRLTTFGLAVIFIILAILIGLIVRNHPPGYVVEKPRSKTSTGLFDALSVVVRNPHTWINALYVGLMFAPTAAFAELWGPRFLAEVYGLNKIHAGFAVSLIYFGWMIGGPFSGWLSDRLGRRKPLMIISAVCGAIFLTLIIYLPHAPLGLVEVCLFGYGVTNFGVAISYALSSEINPRRIAGTSMSFANMASVVVGSWLFMPLIGWLIDRHAVQTVGGHYLYTAHDFRGAMFMLPVCMVLAVVVGWFVRESYCQNSRG